ncbi:nucleoside hydrolase [Pseudohaliea rubra]|uniref:Inosine-uridine preferring nucleoside hydrolase n=1 Tax=Pseudohaliea rubra DSM 19751 TaxID=1265313 RepID=A0A095VMS5_9GAMM|nr:nucleoside hydrolase [Pseudohaliea rubra]KGE02665.1 Inosine-uridine preferring nucleoside hydrolase [Pseudohaliea rubra DSM 19751]
MKRVIFDTDIGIDDAMALLFLHFAPGAELAAITTVAGNASLDNVTRNALVVAERFGIDAPVFRGATGPLGDALGEGYPDFVHGANGLGDIPLPAPARRAEALPAAEAIVALARQQPGELSLVAVGRLTNLAAALALEPALPGLLKELVVMGGVFGFHGHRGNVSPVTEANFGGDPLAADRVLGAGIATTVVGLDVTEETVMDEAFIDALVARAGDAGAFIHAITRFYFDFYEGLGKGRQCPIHDSSAVACLLDPALYETAEGPVRVVTEGVALGQSILGEHPQRYLSDAWRDRPPCRVARTVTAGAVRALYLDCLAHGRA